MSLSPNTIRWGSFALATIIPTIAWWAYYQKTLLSVTVYQIFPLFGIIAFCIMATHFYFHVFTALGKKWPENNAYTLVSGYAVLCLILMHPIFLYGALIVDGYGIPPFSAYEYYDTSYMPFILLGTAGLTLFLLYEIYKLTSKKSFWQRYRLYLIVTQYIAMALIYVHALKIGLITDTGWFAIIWNITSLLVLISTFIVLPYEFKKSKQGK